MIPRALRGAALALCAIAAAPLVVSAAAQEVDVIRGQVTGPERLPIERANVTATSVSGGVNRTTRTDASGRFTITFPGSEGDYFITVTAIGYVPHRFEVKRTADQEILVADLQMQRATAMLDTVKTVARAQVSRNDRGADIGGTERPVNAASVPAGSMGDLNAMAASIPGVTPVIDPNGDPAGYSVLGLSADQNQNTLNGMPTSASNLPRDANVSSTLTTTPYDVSRGGFSGAQFSLRTQPGSNFIRRTASLNLDAPPMQWTDRAAQALGQQYTSFSLGGAAGGPVVPDKAFYNVSYQLGRRMSDAHSLLDTDPLGLKTSGVSIDSVTRLLDILRVAGVPVETDAFGANRVSQNGSIFGSVDYAPPGISGGQTFNVTGNLFYNRRTPATPLTTEVPSHSGERLNLQGGVQARHSAYVNSILSETSVGVNGTRNRGTPFLAVPNGSVLVSSSFDDGTSSVRALGFGGNPFIGTSGSTLGLDAFNTLSWFSMDNQHRLKLTTELRHEQYWQDQTTNQLGTFSYNSLADLSAGRAASYTRQLGPRTQSGSETVLGASLGDSWRVSPNLQVQYGVRVDANRFGTVPAYNPLVEQLFGVRNDEAPNNIAFSPRVGFSWSYGDAPTISAFEGQARLPRAVVRGGAGVFQNTPQASLLGGAVDNTGLAGAVQQLACVGSAVPVAAWSSYLADPSTIPTLCTDGTSGSAFSSRVPNVSLFAPDYASQRSVRGSLQWQGPVVQNRFMATIEGTYSYNTNQPAGYDLNFVNAVQFTLPLEDGRPVYAKPSSIVPATGAVVPGDARRSPLFARVLQQRSDLLSDAKQLRLSVSPSTFSTGLTWSLNYVWAMNREQTRGFSSTAGDPTAVEWSRSGFDARHQLSYSLGYNFFNTVTVSWFGQFRSGQPFTPLVSGDVNGDGYSNDRAFVFDPNGAGIDPAIAAGMRQLLQTGSPEARACLERQMGTVAARNSCEGPWTSNANMTFTFNPLKVRLPQRANLSFQLNNPLGAADLLLHGQDNLKGWGQSAFPDNALLYVRGFDAATSSYRYEVNSRFGNSSPQTSGFRSPVTLTAMLRIDIGPSRERQQLTQQLDRGRRTEGEKVQENILKLQYGSGGILNPLAQILRQGDTLQLTGVQADSIATLNRAYVIRLDSIWTPVAREWANLPKEYDQGEAYHRYKTAREASVDLLINLAPTINALLTPEQKRRLPSLVSGYLDTRYLASIRSGTAGQTGSPGGFPVGFGGGDRVIIRTGP